MAGRWFIYVLRDPRDNAVRYVGKTSRPHERLKRHLVGDEARLYKGRWIRGLRDLGLKPAFEIIDAGRGTGHGAAERAWIAEYRRRGARLTNTASGGIGGSGPCSPEARAKISRANTGKVRTDETIARWRAAVLGTHQPEDAVRRRAEALRGQKRTPEQCARIGAAKRASGYAHSYETKQKIAASLTGKTLSEETKAKLRVAQKARRERERGR